MKKFILILVLSLLILILLAWAPWVTSAFAEERAAQDFSHSWQGVSDGCGLNCKGCGAKAIQKTWFGYQVEIEYACGLIPEDTAAYHQHGKGIVSFLGTVHGLPRP